MEIYEYILKKDQTLKDVAEKFNLSITELLAFHNENCKMSQQITSDYIPLHVLSILVDPQNVKYLDADENQSLKIPKALKYKFPPNATYKIEISTSLYYMGKPLSENKIESIWQINYNEYSNSILVELIDKSYIKVDGQIKPLLEIVDKINKSTEILNIQLDQNKTVKDVINTEKVLEKWEKIKFAELKIYELEDDYFTILIEAFDKEFKSLAKSLQLNILYQIFFYPQINLDVTRNEFKIAVKDKKTISQLFPQQQISYDLWNKSEILNNRTEVYCKAEKHASWNTDLLESEFKKDYSQLLKEAFDYSFTLESKYFYNSEDILEKGKTYIKEKASDELFYIGEYDITLLPHDNKELNLEL